MFDDLRNALGERLDTSFHPGRPGAPVVVIGHGVTANKDRPFLVALADGLAAAGLAALRVSFSGNGGSEGRFEDATVTKEVADLGAVLDALERAEAGPLAYVGHSMGGAVGVLRASVDPRVAALVSLAGMVALRAFAARKFGDLLPGRDTMWNKPECPLSQAFQDDMARIDTVVGQAADVRVPWLLVHGTGDEVVPCEDSRTALERAPAAELLELEGTGHLFEGAATDAMVAAVAPWLAARLLQ